MDTKFDFFIAYASPDADSAEELSWELQDLDRIVFYDKAGLDSAVTWDAELLAALNGARVVVPLVSCNTPAAWYEREEVARAIRAVRSKPGVAVKPVILAGATSNDVPYGLEIAQSIDGTLAGGMKRVAKLLHSAFPPSDPTGIRPYLNSYYALGAALRLDRVKQWSEILEASQISQNALFLLHGPHDQNVGLFLERIQRFFSQELMLPRKIYRVTFNIQGQTPRNGADWLAHMRDAFRSSKPLGAELRQLVQRQPIFVLLGQNPLPLERLDEQHIDALREFVTEKLPALLREPGLQSNVWFMLAFDYEQEPTERLAKLGEWGAQAGDSGTLRFRPLPRVSLPTWDEVESYLTAQITPKPSQDQIVLIRQEYTRHASNPDLSFDRLARLIDRYTLTGQ